MTLKAHKPNLSILQMQMLSSEVISLVRNHRVKKQMESDSDFLILGHIHGTSNVQIYQKNISCLKLTLFEKNV